MRNKIKLLIITLAFSMNACNGQPVTICGDVTLYPNDSIDVAISFAPLDAGQSWGFTERLPDPRDYKKVTQEKFYRYGSSFTHHTAKKFIKEYHDSVYNGRCGFYKYSAKWGNHEHGVQMNFQNCNANYADAKKLID